jgi:hypothetical protein
MYRRRMTEFLSQNTFRITVIIIVFLLIGTYVTPLLATIPEQQHTQSDQTITEGQILYSPMWSTMTYLRECTGELNHTWYSTYSPGAMVRWVGHGTILRAIRVTAGPDYTGGTGGGIQKILWDGTIVWDFRYNTDEYLSHHDIRMLPNGNILMIAWETKTRVEAIAAGRNPIFVTTQGFLPDHIIEVQQTGPTSGSIVWEWHVWDHLIQDYDSSKDNYGMVADHPELVNINYITSTHPDWMHTNSIDYNEEFDQILLSVHNFNEIWVIDHSTTTEEAASHTGGNSGKGGDLLYRWGNPAAYGRGTASDQKLFLQHDANWIDSGCPGDGHILLFNNGGVRLFSTVDEIVPPVDETGKYYITEGSPYGPTNPTWTYSPQPSFYASFLSGAERLSSGNTLITNGETGEVLEVTPEGVTVWYYNIGWQIFKVVYIPPQEPEEPNIPDVHCAGSLSWPDVEPGATLTGDFRVQNIGDNESLLNWRINTSSISWGTWSFIPDSGNNLAPEDGSLTVHLTVIAPDEPDSTFEGSIRIENVEDPTDFDTVPVILTTPIKIIPPWLIYLRQFFSHIFQQHALLQRLCELLSIQ